MSTVFTSLEALVPFAKARSKRGIYNGRVDAAARRLIDLCTHEWHIGFSLRVILIFTRDAGHHSEGWWKNPDYERCFHELSCRGNYPHFEFSLPAEQGELDNLVRGLRRAFNAGKRVRSAEIAELINTVDE